MLAVPTRSLSLLLSALGCAVAAGGAASSAQAAPTNTVPPSVVAPVSQVGAPFSIDPGSWTGSGPITFSYAWARCTGPNPGDCAVASAVDDGDHYIPSTGTERVFVSVAATDASGTSVVGASSGVIAAQPAGAPGTTTLPQPTISPGTPNQVAGTTFTASRGTWSPDGATFEYRWFRCGPGGTVCRFIASTPPSADTLTSSYTSTAADTGSQLVVMVTGIAAGGGRSSRFSTSTPFIGPAGGAVIPRGTTLPLPPQPRRPAAATPAKPLLVRRPALSGRARVGATLRVKRGTWAGATAFGYRWLRNGRAIARATASRYRLRRTDRGKRISCQITARNVAGTTIARTTARRVR
jgi:hypothetical protein